MAQEIIDIGTGTTGNTISSAIIVPLIQHVIRQIEDVIHLDQNRQLLEEQLNRMNNILLDINAQFQVQQREVPFYVKNSLLRMQQQVEKGRELILCSQRPLRWTDCLLPCKPKVSTQIREWKTTFNGLFVQLNTDFLLFCSAQHIASTAPQLENELLQDQPDTGLVGLDFKEDEKHLEWWLKEAPHARIIAVCGMGGVGKTTLLKKVYNTFVEVSDRIFDNVIWVTVSHFPLLELQRCIASAINLDLSHCPSNDMRKMKLAAYLKKKRFFIVLDDMWSLLNLKELGVEFGTDTGKGSKLVFSTRNRDLIQEMNAEESLQLQPLKTEEAWDLFCRIAFKDGHLPDQDIRQIAREVANECQGLPLAINVIASTMKGYTAINQWKFALRQMQTVDINFPTTHPRIDRDLYQRLKWSTIVCLMLISKIAFFTVPCSRKMH